VILAPPLCAYNLNPIYFDQLEPLIIKGYDSIKQLNRYVISDSLVDAMAHLPRTHEDYQIGVICALPTEKAAMVAIMDETHPRLKKEKGDENEYTLGRIGVHNVIVACLPAGLMGIGPTRRPNKIAAQPRIVNVVFAPTSNPARRSDRRHL
jgi:hypothetical protein